MIVEIRGGPGDGIEFDTDDGGIAASCTWCCPEMTLRPVPTELLLDRVDAPGLAVYRLSAASEDRVTYQHDAPASAQLSPPTSAAAL